MYTPLPKHIGVLRVLSYFFVTNKAFKLYEKTGIFCICFYIFCFKWAHEKYTQYENHLEYSNYVKAPSYWNRPVAACHEADTI